MRTVNMADDASVGRASARAINPNFRSTTEITTRRGGIFWGLVLLVLGGIWLIGSVGYITLNPHLMPPVLVILRGLDLPGAIILKSQGLEGQIRHAEQGYSGLVADVKVLEPQLNNLYQFDATMLDGLDALSAEASGLEADAGGDAGKVMDRIGKLRSGLQNLEQTFKTRMLVITGTKVT